MKILILLTLQGAFATKIAYGPSNCIALDLSSEGTCVIKTNCAGVNVDNFEFAFDCTTPKHDVQRHSFGFGGFDAQEEFDTSVKCTICEPPTDKHHVLVSTGSKSKSTVTKNSVLSSSRSSDGKDKESDGKDKESEKKSDSGSENILKKATDAVTGTSDSETGKVVKYGPDECVSTYRNPAGHCIMQTQCAQQNITDYEFGLVCVDKTGEPVRHIFGKDSFDKEESFDTLIACDKCLGLDDIADETSLVKQVETLTSEVEEMNKTLSTMRTSVKKLKGKVFPAPAPAPAPAALSKVSSSTKEIKAAPVAAKRKQVKLHLKKAKAKKHTHMRKIQKEEDDDSDEDEDQDQEQDEDQEKDEDQDQDDQQDDSEDA